MQRRADVVRMRDVAAAAGVSTKTVSEVVNGVGSVRDSTRRRVLQAVEDLGYRPNPAARRLNSENTGLVFVAIPRLSTPADAALVAAIIAAAEPRGIEVVIEPTGGLLGRDVELVHDASGMADGVLVVAEGRYSAADRRLPIPVVVVGEAEDIEEVDLVESSLRRGAELALDHLRPAVDDVVLLVGPERAFDGLEGFLVHAPDDFDAAFIAVRATLDHRTPRSIVIVGVAAAVGALHALRDAGLRVPADVEVVAVGVGTESAYAVPSLTAVEQDVDEIANAALGRLGARIAGDSSARHSIAPAWRVVARESTVPR